jgi:hypothetical protein
MQYATQDELKLLRFLINAQRGDKIVDSDAASYFHSLLWPHWPGVPTPYQIKQYANELEPMPTTIYEKMINVKHCDAD